MVKTWFLGSSEFNWGLLASMVTCCKNLGIRVIELVVEAPDERRQRGRQSPRKQGVRRWQRLLSHCQTLVKASHSKVVAVAAPCPCSFLWIGLSVPVDRALWSYLISGLSPLQLHSSISPCQGPLVRLQAVCTPGNWCFCTVVFVVYGLSSV